LQFLQFLYRYLPRAWSKLIEQLSGLKGDGVIPRAHGANAYRIKMSILSNYVIPRAHGANENYIYSALSSMSLSPARMEQTIVVYSCITSINVIPRAHGANVVFKRTFCAFDRYPPRAWSKPSVTL